MLDGRADSAAGRDGPGLPLTPDGQDLSNARQQASAHPVRPRRRREHHHHQARLRRHRRTSLLRRRAVALGVQRQPPEQPRPVFRARCRGLGRVRGRPGPRPRSADTPTPTPDGRIPGLRAGSCPTSSRSTESTITSSTRTPDRCSRTPITSEPIEASWIGDQAFTDSSEASTPFQGFQPTQPHCEYPLGGPEGVPDWRRRQHRDSFPRSLVFLPSGERSGLVVMIGGGLVVCLVPGGHTGPAEDLNRTGFSGGSYP